MTSSSSLRRSLLPPDRVCRSSSCSPASLSPFLPLPPPSSISSPSVSLSSTLRRPAALPPPLLILRAARRRADERDNSSSIRPSAVPPLFGLLPITLLFALICPSRRLRRVIGEREAGGSSLQLQSGAMHSRGASARCGGFVDSSTEDAIKNS